MNDLDELADDLAKEPLAEQLRRLVPALSQSDAERIYRAHATRRRRSRRRFALAGAAVVGLCVVGVARLQGQRGQSVDVVAAPTASAPPATTTAMSGPSEPAEGLPAGGGVPSDPFTCAQPLVSYWARTATVDGQPLTVESDAPTFAAVTAVSDQYRGPDAAGLELRASQSMSPTYGIVNGLLNGRIVVRFHLLSTGDGLVISDITICPAGGWPDQPIVAPPTKGPAPEAARRTDGTVDWTKVPQFVSVVDLDELAGYVRASDVLSTPNQPNPPAMSTAVAVYADDLTTVVGHLYPDIGFLPLGTDPSTVPQPLACAEVLRDGFVILLGNGDSLKCVDSTGAVVQIIAADCEGRFLYIADGIVGAQPGWWTSDEQVFHAADPEPASIAAPEGCIQHPPTPTSG